MAILLFCYSCEIEDIKDSKVTLSKLQGAWVSVAHIEKLYETNSLIQARNIAEYTELVFQNDTVYSYDGTGFYHNRKELFQKDSLFSFVRNEWVNQEKDTFKLKEIRHDTLFISGKTKFLKYVKSKKVYEPEVSKGWSDAIDNWFLGKYTILLKDKSIDVEFSNESNFKGLYCYSKGFHNDEIDNDYITVKPKSYDKNCELSVLRFRVDSTTANKFYLTQSSEISYSEIGLLPDKGENAVLIRK